MLITFYIAALVAAAATLMVITRVNAVHALLYLIVSLLAGAIIFYTLGAPFIAALEVMVYAGAIMVLFVFVMMMLNLGEAATIQERGWLKPQMWVGPALLSLVLLGLIVHLLTQAGPGAPAAAAVVPPVAVGVALYGPYLLGVELASVLLMAGLVGAYHLGRRYEQVQNNKPPREDA